MYSECTQPHKASSDRPLHALCVERESEWFSTLSVKE